MPVNDRFSEYEQRAQILQRIAQRYADDSIEVATLKEAALALYLALEKGRDFAVYMKQANASLTGEQKARLRSLGIDAFWPAAK